jgi:hypothetical protein
MGDKIYSEDKEVLLLRRELLEIQKKERIGFWDWLLYVYTIPLPPKKKRIPILPLNLLLFYAFYKWIAKPFIGLAHFPPLYQSFLGLLATTFVFYILYSKLVHTPKEKKQQTILGYLKYYYPIVLRKIKNILGLE